MLDSSKDNLKLEAMKRIIGVRFDVLATILDKINGTSGPPLPPISMMPKWRALLFARLHHCLGGRGVNCSILYCPRLSEIRTGVTCCVIYGNGVLS